MRNLVDEPEVMYEGVWEEKYVQGFQNVTHFSTKNATFFPKLVYTSKFKDSEESKEGRTGKVRMFFTRCEVPSLQEDYGFFSSLFFESCEQRSLMGILATEGIFSRFFAYFFSKGYNQSDEEAQKRTLQTALMVNSILFDG